MISPCEGCDPHLAAAIVCYLSFFLSSCSFFLYWYWIGNYREEINPLEGRYSSPEGSECDALEPELNPDQDPDTTYYSPSTHFYSPNDAETPTTSTHVPDHLQEITNISSCVQHSEEEEGTGQHLLSLDASVESNLCSSIGGESDSFIINTITLPLPSTPPHSSRSRHPLTAGDDLDSIQRHPGGDEDEEGGDGGRKISAVSGNPYLNGDTYSQNLLWGFHGIFTNLIEAILAAVFYSGLFEDNLKTSLAWVIGFSSNFIVGNFLYVLLLLYCTNRGKVKQLWGRWLIECVFNVVKDLYWIWIGVSFLDSLVKRSINPT